MTAHNRSAGRLILLLTAMLLLLSACSLINRNAPSSRLGHETLLADQGVLTCSSECRARGQCGTTPDETVILGGIFEPRTSQHDIYFPDGATVTLLFGQPYTLRQIVDGSELSINFYNVSTQDNTRSGWIAGWCVAAP